MALERVDPLILAVDDGAWWRDFMGRQLEVAGVRHEVVGDADTALDRLDSDEFTGVITDDLDGRWLGIVAAASLASAGVVVVSHDPAVLRGARHLEIQAHSKFELGDGPRVMMGIINSLTADPR